MSGKAKVNDHSPFNQRIVTKGAGYCWNAGNWELPERAGRAGKRRQASVILPDCPREVFNWESPVPRKWRADALQLGGHLTGWPA